MLSAQNKSSFNYNIKSQFEKKGGERENTNAREGGEAEGRELVMERGFYLALGK
jgi:hypothetical protein